jgi:hypothetical protein
VSDKPFVEIAEDYRKQFNELLQEATRETILATVAQIPDLMQRTDWSQEQRIEAVKLLQSALVTPCINLSVNAAYGCSMSLADFLSYTAKCWEHLRNERLGRMIKEQLTKDELPKEG